MDEYLIVPKRVMDQKEKEMPEATEVSNLGQLTNKIIHRTGISDWEKADLLAASLQRFLAHRPSRPGQGPASTQPLLTDGFLGANIETGNQLDMDIKPQTPSEDMSVEEGYSKKRGKTYRKQNIFDEMRVGKKRKARKSGQVPKRLKVVLDDLMSEDDEPLQGVKRKAEDEDIFTKRMRTERGQKRKGQEFQPDQKRIKLEKTLKRKSDAVHPVSKRIKVGPTLKRKIDELDEPDNLLRKRSQTGGKLNWIYVY